MKYYSTRGNDGPLGYEEALLSGLARDGGLYLPESYPAFSDDETRGVTSLPVSFLAEVLRLGGGDCSCLLNDPGSLADPLM